MFELGWLFWLLVAALFFGCGRACGWGGSRRRSHLEDGRDHRQRVPDRGSRKELGTRPQAGGDARQPVAAGAGRRESPLKTLQRRFVEGRITLEEYEHQLDQLERLE